jgi:hypothetical protein
VSKVDIYDPVFRV